MTPFTQNLAIAVSLIVVSNVAVFGLALLFKFVVRRRK